MTLTVDTITVTVATVAQAVKVATVILICNSCNSKIPKLQPFLYCDLCLEYKYLKCEKLQTKSHAAHINSIGLSWTCSRCIEEILPINAVRKPENVKISNDN